MKLILFASIVFVTTSCNYSTPVNNSAGQSTTVVALIDPTDKRQVYPTSHELIEQFDFAKRKSAAGILRMRLIGDRIHTPSATIRLPDAHSMEQANKTFDPHFRERNIEAYMKHVHISVSNFYRLIDTTRTLEHSEIYRTLCDELTQLTKDSSDRKIVVAATDCSENSDIFRMHTVKKIDVNQVAAHLTKAYPLPDNLTGINIIFLFSPRDREEDARYYQSLQLFRFMLEARGATIEIRTSL